MSKWIGYAVTVNCGEPLGCYQGTIVEADGTTLTLTKAFRNGFPYPKSQVTLNAADIRDLKIIETRPEPAEPTHSTVALAKTNKKGQRATVCENLQANPSNSGGAAAAGGAAGGAGGAGGGRAAAARSKPIDIQGGRAHSGSYGHERARRRNEACFGEAASPALLDDFDFEGNLALFDKRALWEQMRHQPDLVRHADPASFRHDENVLGGGGGGAGERRRALRVPPALRAGAEYASDEGVVVGAVAESVRAELWAALGRAGLGGAARALLARAAADVALRLVGGERRLEPRNAHQPPTCVALAGAHRAAAAALLGARLLASHGARAGYLVLGGAAAAGEAVRREAAALALAGVAEAPALEALPRPDVVLLALDAGEAGAAAALRWGGGRRAALVALEPAAAGWEALGVAARASVLGLAPGALAASLGRVYLADVAPPPRLFAELGLWYRPPFGAASVLALHPLDD